MSESHQNQINALQGLEHDLEHIVDMIEPWLTRDDGFSYDLLIALHRLYASAFEACKELQEDKERS